MLRSVLGCVLVLSFFAAACKPATTSPPASTPPTDEAAFDPDAGVSGKLPAAEIQPPQDGWWKSARPCPQGTKLVEKQLPPVTEGEQPVESQAFQCERPDGTEHGAHTLLLDGEVSLSGWYKDGFQHGHQRSSSKAASRTDDAAYDEGMGIGTWKSREGELVTTKEHRVAGQIWFTQRLADGTRVAEGLLVDGQREGAWSFGDGSDQRTVRYEAGKAEGGSSITGHAECDAGVQRWRRCLDTKRGAERYAMAEWLSFYVLAWERAPLAGDGVATCAMHMPLLAKQLEAYGCAAD